MATTKTENAGGGGSAHVHSPSSFLWFVGMMMASFFCFVYIVTPFYLLAASLAVLLGYPSTMWSLVFVSPIVLSVAFKPVASPRIVRMLSPMLDYFDYEQILETKPVDARQKILDGTNYIIGVQAHGVISFCGICSAIYAGPEFQCKLPTAVASAVLHMPILKHVMGIFGLIDASKQNIQKALKKPGVEGCVVIYVGGIAELFMSSPEEERLFLSQRKGFIKLALTEGVDVVPVYLFGNTSVLTVIRTGILASLSRKLQVSLTYFWGKYYLPIPRNEKLLYVGGTPLGMPHIPNPTQADIDKWHAVYCKEVTRIFDTYKERLPMYKHKKLIIA